LELQISLLEFILPNSEKSKSVDEIISENPLISEFKHMHTTHTHTHTHTRTHAHAHAHAHTHTTHTHTHTHTHAHTPHLQFLNPIVPPGGQRKRTCYGKGS
jgi:ABC-type Zn2+ transport system substrate-binding protein/surface adhesin